MMVSDQYVELKVVENYAIDPISMQEIPAHKQPFVSAILFLKAQLKVILRDSTDSNDKIDAKTSISSLDTSRFGTTSRLDRAKELELVLPAIQERRLELYQQKEHWRAFVNTKQLGIDCGFYAQIERALKDGKLVPNSSGAGSSYFIVDAQGVQRFVVKPVDGDVFCLNNRKGFNSAFNDSDHCVREGIPLYRSAQTDAFCWEVASLVGLEGTTPRAVICILEDSGFYDFSCELEEGIKDRVLQEAGMSDTEKLCSVQEFIPDSQNLIELLHQFYSEELSEEEIAARFDQDDFEQACLFLWLSFDNDAHGGNFLTYVKRIDAMGKKTYGIKKIDNGLSFPEKNTHYNDILAWVPNALLPISPELKRKIAHLPVEQILQRMDDYELCNCKEAFKERLEIIKMLSQREEITAAEIDLRMTFLSRKDGKEIALNAMTTQEILELLAGTSTHLSSSLTSTMSTQ